MRVMALLLWMTLGVLVGVAGSRRRRRQQVAARLNALIAADPPQDDFEREKARIVRDRRGRALAAAVLGALGGAALYGAVLGLLWLTGRA